MWKYRTIPLQKSRADGPHVDQTTGVYTKYNTSKVVQVMRKLKGEQTEVQAY
jgi:hypothetical protein